MKGRRFQFIVTVAILGLAILGCNTLSFKKIAAKTANPETKPTETQSAGAQPTKTPVPKPSDTPEVSDTFLRQWAVFATANSEYGAQDWSAMQATGKPNTEECGDKVTAWAAANDDTVEWLELTYSTAVYASEINIYETYTPNQVVKVELIDIEGKYHVVYEATPKDMADNCPYTLSIKLNAEFPSNRVMITLDQSILNTSWNEIDAVELVGRAAGGVSSGAGPTSTPGVPKPPQGGGTTGGGGVPGGVVVAPSPTPTGEFPIPDGAMILTQGEGTLSFMIEMGLDELMAYYRDKLTAMGYEEQTAMTLKTDEMFSMVFKELSTGKNLLVQGSTSGEKTFVQLMYIQMGTSS